MQQKKIFTEGVNSDTTSEMLPDGSDRFRLNVRALSSNNSTVGAIETVNGNTLVNYTLPVGGTYTVIGSREYTVKNKIYYFVYCTTAANNIILQYDSVTNAVTKVLQHAGLNFSPNYLINSINFVELDVDSNLMYWTDNYNEPRKINIEKGIYYSAGNYTLGYPNTFDITWINRIKMPPAAPTAVWSNDSSLTTNKLYKKNYTFKLRYVFDDKEVSAFSPISPYAWPEVLYLTTNTTKDYYTQNNQIVVGFNSGSGIVKKIQIAAKETNDTDYFLLTELDKEISGYADNTNYSFIFSNEGLYIPIEVNESIKLFDNVPQLSQTHDIISGNRIADGNIVEGYDSVDISMELTLDYVTIDNSQPNPKPITDASYLKSGGSYVFGVVYYDAFNRSGTTNINSGTKLDVPFLSETSYTPAIVNSAPDVRWDIYNEAPSWATHYQILRSKNNAVSKYFQFVAEAVYYYDAATNSTIVDPTIFPSGQLNIQIANIIGIYKTSYPNSILVYDFTKGDRIRFIANPPYIQSPYPAPPPPIVNGTPYAFTGPSASSPYGVLPDVVNLPYLDYEIVSFDVASQTVSVKIDGSAVIPLSDLILPGALYEIYTPAKQTEIQYQIMHEIGEVHDITVDANGRYIHEGTSGNQKIVDSASSTYAAPNLTMAVPTGHGLINGDKVKVIITATGAYAYGVITVSAANSITIDTTTGSYTGAASNLASVIYKSAYGNFTSGDSFRPYQDMPYRISGVTPSGYPSAANYSWYCHVENMNVNNFYNSKDWDYGRPNRYDPDYRQINRKSTIVYSESFIPETNINGLSSVFDTSFETYQDKFGGIYKLYSEDQSLIMFQELKISRIPVQQVIYNDLQGGNTVGASATVLSSQPIYYAGEFGIGKHPESFAVYGNAKYGIDIARGAVWRLSIDGLTPISKTGFMDNYITDKSQEILAQASKVNIFGGYDSKFNEYIIAFNAYGAASAETLAWNERANAWSSFYSYNPETIATKGTGIVTFKAGKIYIHNTNAIQANFYGVQYYPEIWAVLNANPSNVKVFEALSQETLDAWEVYSITNDDGQLSNLIVSDFTEIENLQYAPLWRDSNTPNVTNPLIEGDSMRSTVFLCKFRRTNTAYNKIFAINFNYIISNLHNR